MLINCLAVGAGGFIGSVFRYLRRIHYVFDVFTGSAESPAKRQRADVRDLCGCKPGDVYRRSSRRKAAGQLSAGIRLLGGQCILLPLSYQGMCSAAFAEWHCNSCA